MQKFTPLYLLLLIVVSIDAFGQNSEPCALKQDNENYILQLKAESDPVKQLAIIADKLHRDTLYKPKETSTQYLRSTYLDYIDEQTNSCGKKILHFVFFNRGEEMIKIDPLLLDEHQVVFEQINSSNLEMIYYFEKGVKSTAMFGAVAIEGTVVIYTQDEKIKELIQLYKDGPKYYL